ncbi:flagellar protein FlaG [Helicovermis profundi]|uniref:Flagellar protein FlaG n=1 Tax=Helicovermis profundi TaxID=3065157 RepID=A0AAU9EHA1_9FIRM|nr:hypothetical protein HLPR_25280 [Clostridia bacterium S502]
MKVDNVNTPVVQTRMDSSSTQNVPKVSNAPNTPKISKDKVDVVEINGVKQNVVDKKNSDNSVLEKAIKQANKSLNHYNREVERQVHDVTGTIMYTIKDTDTGEVIAEFPPKKIEDMIAKMWEMAGMVVDKKA